MCPEVPDCTPSSFRGVESGVLFSQVCTGVLHGPPEPQSENPQFSTILLRLVFLVREPKLTGNDPSSSQTQGFDEVVGTSPVRDRGRPSVRRPRREE